MDVAVGGNTVVLAQTVNGAAFASATPTVNFLPTVFANGTLMRNGTTNPDLAAIAPLTCAEVSRNGVNATNGFVYVGGANGLLACNSQVLMLAGMVIRVLMHLTMQVLVVRKLLEQTPRL